MSPLRRKLRTKVVATILDAAEQVALEAGLGGMTIGAVADRAGVAVGTLYNYFSNGEAIITAVFRARRAVLVPAIRAQVVATKQLAFEDRLRELVRRLLDLFQTHETFVRIAMLADRAGNRSKPRDTALEDATLAALATVMRDGVRRRWFPANRAAIYARMMHNALRAMFVWRLTDDQPFSVDGAMVVDVFLAGIRPTANRPGPRRRR